MRSRTRVRTVPGPRVTRLWPLAAVLVLTACTSTVTGEPSPAVDDALTGEVFESVEPPQLGACLDTTDGGYGYTSPPKTLPCDEPHGGEVAEVVEIPESFGEEYPDEDDEALSDLLIGDDGCGDDLATTYLGAREEDNVLAESAAYLPKLDAWEAGARWAACVVYFVLDFAERADAPGRIAGAMRGPDAAAYRECWFGPQESFDIVPCSESHEAEPTRYAQYVDIDAPYPQDEATLQEFREICFDDVANYLERRPPDGYVADVYLPNLEDWELYNAYYCVVLAEVGGRTTGSVFDA